jgi:hypothetical protein
MQFRSGRSKEEFLADLTAEAERTWGAARLPALAETLETAAGALWRMAQVPFEPLGGEPDFIGAGTLTIGAHLIEVHE